MRSLCFAALLLTACGVHEESLGDQSANPTDGGDTDALAGFDVQPSGLQTITVLRGQMMPAITYQATLAGAPIAVGWTVDRGDVGFVPAGPSESATVNPTGTTGGMLTVRARLGMQEISRQIFVQLDAGSQNGVDSSNPDEAKQTAMTTGDLHTGGGVGGVGGEGLGTAVTDPATMTALDTPVGDGSAQMLKLVYPYDATVWPRGLLAPLLQWDWSQGDADAIKIELTTTSGSFKWTGTFAKPAILMQSGTPTAGKFIRHPIPQDIWAAATDTAGGQTSSGVDKLTVKLTIARGGQAFGPITQTWSVAAARLTGTVYYNSYGTSYADNFSGTKDTNGHPVGAAILGIRSGDIAPHLVVGQNSADNSGCRVCHIVSSRGGSLIAQAENAPSYLYDLTAANVQGSAIHLPSDGTFAWAAMSSDASYALTNALDPSSTNDAANITSSAVYNFGGPPGSNVTAAPAIGLPSGVAAGYPSFSPDDKYVSYIDVTGNLNDIVNRPIVIGQYDAMTQTFSNMSTVFTPPMGSRVGYPAFLPDSSAIVFEQEVRKGASDTVMVTRNSARSELWWLQNAASTSPVALKTLNGYNGASSYLPIGVNQHGLNNTGTEIGFDDTTLDYEPTVLPIVSGGYAWVVFTSRRLYGSVSTTDPWASNPTLYDLTDPAAAPTKKLWVAAIDLKAPGGSDPSHPAFYLPAQELTAGNSRGFWVLDPCKTDGNTCESGDQCCNGYCEPDPSNPASLICTNTATCSNPQEKCVTASDCCDTTNTCVNGFCAASQIL